MDIISADLPEWVHEARLLFEEYAASLPFDLCFQNFERELAELPGAYAPPAGRLLLGRHEGETIGCVALRPLSESICEIKRLYLRPRFRGQGAGRGLVLAAIRESRQIGYERIRLDTHTSMEEAIALYRSIGFAPIEPYAIVPLPDVVFMELPLSR